MKTRIAAALAAAVLATAAPISSAMAFNSAAPVERFAPTPVYDGYGIGSLGHHDHARFTGCPMSSASEGNANQQNFPVKQYGQTSGGHRC